MSQETRFRPLETQLDEDAAFRTLQVATLGAVVG